MDSKMQFSALETMCRERARIAKTEFEYWLAEANEWARLKNSSDAHMRDIPVQLDLCLDPDGGQIGLLGDDCSHPLGAPPRLI